jgi:hypothetical protein
MRLALVAVAIVALAGCSAIKQEDTRVDSDVAHMQQEQDAIGAAAKRIEVVHGPNVKGHPQYTELGRTEGYCFNLPNATSGQVIHGDGLRAAAYRKYGAQVDAIVNTTMWFVPDYDSGVAEPYTEPGYFECAGTAVHFNDYPGIPKEPSL